MNYKLRVIIKGEKNHKKLNKIGEQLMSVNKEATDWLNNGGIEAFNKAWDISHSVEDDYIYGDDYVDAYLDYQKALFDLICMRKKLNYLIEREDGIVITDDGYIILSGYKI